MPFQNLVPLVQSSQVIAVNCPLEYGISHLIQELSSHKQPVVWLELDHKDQDDPVSIGNKLADAVNYVFDSQLLSSFSYEYNLAVLQSLLPTLGPITLVLTQAHIEPSLAKAVLKLQGKACRIIIQANPTAKHFSLPTKTLKLSKEDFVLTAREALKLVAKRLDKKETLELLKVSEYAYDVFLSNLHKLLNLPPHLIPGPNGHRTLPGFEIKTKPESLLKVLLRKKHWIEALELAIERLPERVPEVLEEAGHSYHEQGLHKRLFYLLEGLDPHIKSHETVLYWRLQAAFRLGQEKELRKEVESYLKKNEAPELRALAAGVFMPTNRKEALRAYKSRKTAFTVMQLGRLSDSKQSLKYLQESVTLAERYGKAYEIPRNAGILANKFLTQGHYEDAVYWFEWSLEQFEKLTIQDGQRKLLILNDWAYTKLHIGEITGLEDILKQQEKFLSSAYPDLAFYFSETIGDFYLATNQSKRALEYYEKNSKNIPKRLLSINTLNRVRALIDIEDITKARKIAERTLHMIHNETPRNQAEAHLAYGMVLSFQDISLARHHLVKAQGIFKEHYHAPRLAQTALYLAFTYMQEAKVKQAREIIRHPSNHIKGLAESGLRLLSGPQEIFRPIWNLLWEDSVNLEMKFLGQQEVWLDGEHIKLFPRQLEILAILALRQRPLTLEEVLVDLEGDYDDTASLKSSISKLRRILPVISSFPYQIATSFRADFLEVLKNLQRGNLKAALNLYQGSLLKYSESPYIRETDTMIFESLRTAILKRQDPELLLQLSAYVDDLELLEKTHPLLEHGDPRKILLQTRIEQLQKDWLN